MYLDGKILQIQRERDKPFLYMPNPAILHHRSIKIDHHLKIVDFFIHAGMPRVFHVEPNWKTYKPDVYMKDRMGNNICVEIQITPISSKKMKTKTIEFMESFKKKEHEATIMLLVSNQAYSQIDLPKPFKLVRLPMPNEPFSEAQKKPS